MRSYCASCRHEYGPDFIFDSTDAVPVCPSCGKMVRPDVTLYGELLPEPAYNNALRQIRRADCLIIGGTSLEVGSAAGLAHSWHGDHLIIINKGKTKMEGKADLVFHDSIGKILGLLDLRDPDDGSTAGDINYEWHSNVNKAHPFLSNDRRIVHK